MAKKQQLTVDNAFDFVLIGILCQYKDYRLCNALNKTLDINLVRIDDLTLQNNKTGEHCEYALYLHSDDDDRQYYVLANIDNNKRYLIPEQSKMDYFVLLKGGFGKEEVETIRQQLKSVPIVLGAYEIPLKKLKSRENLLF